MKYYKKEKEIIGLDRIDDFILLIHHYNLDEKTTDTEEVFFEEKILKRITIIKQEYQFMDTLDEELKEQFEDYDYYAFSEFPEPNLYFRKEHLIIHYDEIFTYYNLNTNSSYTRTFYSDDSKHYKIIQLKNECEVLTTIDNPLQKKLDKCLPQELINAKIYKRNKGRLVGANAKRKTIFIIDGELEIHDFKTNLELEKVLKKEIKGHHIVDPFTLSDDESSIFLMLYDEDDFKPTYEAQFSKEFPFFGAGNASYFEAYSLTIYFETIPSKKDKTRITKLLPGTLNAEVEDFNSRFLNVFMEYGYDYIDDDFDEYNTDIEKALLAIHKFQPIVFAYRTEDTEAAGTKFSKWHTHSGEQLENIVDKIEIRLKDLPAKETLDLKEYLKEIYCLYDKDEKRFNSKQWH